MSDPLAPLREAVCRRTQQTTGVEMIVFRSPVPPPSQTVALGLQSNFHSSLGLPPLPAAAAKL